MTALCYDSSVFDRLSGPSQALATLTARPGGLEAAGTVIVKHGLQDVAGIALLHRHFDLAPGERVVRTVEADHALLGVACVGGGGDKDEDDGHSHSHGGDDRAVGALVPYTWSFAQSCDRLAVPLEFTDPVRHPLAARQADQIEANTAFLLAMRETLVSYGIADVVGVSSLHLLELLPLAPGMILRESPCSDAPRQERLDVVSKAADRRLKVVPTLWVSEQKEGAPGERVTLRQCLDCEHEEGDPNIGVHRASGSAGAQSPDLSPPPSSRAPSTGETATARETRDTQGLVSLHVVAGCNECHTDDVTTTLP